MNKEQREKILNDINSTDAQWVNLSTKKVKILFRYLDILERALMVSDDEVENWLRFARDSL